MARRNGPVHVVKNIRKHKGKEYTSYLLRRSYRVGKKVMKETVANLSHLPEELIDLIRRYLKGERFAGVDEAFEIQRTLPHGHVAATLGTLRGLGLDTLLGSKPSRRRTLAVAMITARIIAPESKLATARGLGSETLSSSLGEVLGLESVSAEDLYGAMDWLGRKQERIEAALAQRRLSEGSLVLYDVTSVYFEGRACPLAKLGHSRDGKKGKLQIVIGLLCDAEGCPVSVRVFEGNTADPKTLAAQIEKLKSRFGLTHVTLVGDRGMLTEARLREDVRPEEGLDWITALRGPAIRGLVAAGSLQPSLFDEREMAEISDPQYPGERLIVCRNPLLADERARKRKELIDATEKGLNEIVAATARASRRLTGADKIGLRVGKTLNRFKVGKYFRTEIREDSFHYSRNEARIAEDAALDGFYVIRTSLPQEIMSAQRTVSTYKSLSRVERAFRSMKSLDLNIRPIHHHLEDRVKAHVFLCMLAYHVEWHMRKALAPMLFDDDHKAEADALRESIVEPAKRSDQATAKAQSGRTEDQHPVHSFQSLLADLATLAKNVVRVNSTDATFVQYTVPTPLQEKALNLLNVPHKM